ncbi:MAG TPA: NUDIX domain-containing protein [Anaeromyxobacteraceae bacterium]|nr:NUDIX domain-containing protein [Anaeromyxobacteraceae bacterium]
MRIPPARLAALRRRLLAWWDAGHRALPWRFPQGSADPYRVWLAEVMLQQTQVRTAIPYYLRFVARFPTLAALAAADDDEVLALWSGLGYYARCRNLLAAARTALARHGGLPASVEALRALPGFGPYTAGAVAAIAFAIPAAAVDGNVARVLARLLLVAGDPSAPAVRRRLWAAAEALVAGTGRPGDLDQALMELGATACGWPAPRCARCPVAALCEARRAGREREVPPPRRRPRRRALSLACAVVERGDRMLLARGDARALFGGLWGLPAVELEAGEAAPRALAAAMLRAHGLALSVGEELASARRTLTHRDLTLVAYRCRLRSRRAAGEGLRWAAPGDLGAVGLSAAMRALLAAVAAAPRRGALSRRAGGALRSANLPRSRIGLTRGGRNV